MMKIFVLILGLITVGCKTTDAGQPGSIVHAVSSNYLNLEQQMAISSDLLPSLNDMSERDGTTCFGKLNPANNLETFGLYLCEFASAISVVTSVTFDVREEFIDTVDGNRTRNLTRNNINIGSIKLINGKWTLTDLCTGTAFDGRCFLEYDDGWLFSFTFGGDDITILKDIPLDSTVTAVLGNIGGRRFCFGHLKSSVGSGYGFYPCSGTQALTMSNIAWVFPTDGVIRDQTNNGFYWRSAFVANMWVWRDKWELRDFCIQAGRTVCQLTYDPVKNRTKLTIL